MVIMEGAQRRPGPRPRRHACRNCRAGITKSCAQRRPGPRPRRHRCSRRRDAGPLETRSTKAGAETPATPLTVLAPCSSGDKRSTKAGAETPATQVVHLHVAPDLRSQQRSTKAGAETPATQCPAVQPPRHRGRPSAAQRRPGPRPRRHTRQHFAVVDVRRTGALNEGRGRDPGDTRSRLLGSFASWTALNGRPVCRDPGDTRRSVSTSLDFTGAQRVWVWMSSQTRRCPRNLRRITTLSQAALESPGVRSFPVRAPKARRARASQSGQTGSELSEMRLLNLYTITESTRSSIASWTSPNMRAIRLGDETDIRRPITEHAPRIFAHLRDLPEALRTLSFRISECRS